MNASSIAVDERGVGTRGGEAAEGGRHQERTSEDGDAIGALGVEGGTLAGGGVPSVSGDVAVPAGVAAVEGAVVAVPAGVAAVEGAGVAGVAATDFTVNGVEPPAGVETAGSASCTSTAARDELTARTVGSNLSGSAAAWPCYMLLAPRVHTDGLLWYVNTLVGSGLLV